jgi:hypothetical protein
MNACATALKQRLALAGTWVDAPVLARGLPFSQSRCDDELADLVVAGEVRFNERLRCYRLAGTALARKAVQQLAQQQGQGPAARVLGTPDKDGNAYRFGVAVRTTEPGGVMRYSMAEVEAEIEPGEAGLQELAKRICAWAHKPAPAQP